MLTNLLPSRRRAEARRVERFVHAIHLSGRYAVNPDWNLTPTADQWPAERTDTVAFPRIILAGTVLTAAVALAGCTGASTEPAETSARPVIEQPDMSGPGRVYADHELREAVRGIAPWLLP